MQQDDNISKNELIELLHAYGHAKLGDEWWPGNAAAVLGEERGRRLAELLGSDPSRPTFITAEYSVECSLGGVYDVDDEVVGTEADLMERAKERLLNELEELVLKRPYELGEFFTIKLSNVNQVEAVE